MRHEQAVCVGLVVLATGAAVWLPTRDGRAEAPPARPAPDVEKLDESGLKRLEEKVRQAAATAATTVVAVKGPDTTFSSSGVIITADGLVLSQFHVTHAVRTDPGAVHEPGTKTTGTLSDGRECPAELLGATRTQDLSLLQLTGPGPYPFTPLKRDATVRPGDWVLKLGHPGGYRVGRPAPVRLGRVVAATKDGFCTDCRITTGDSGGPFFDLDGRLVGIVRCGSADLLDLLPEDPVAAERSGPMLFSATGCALADAHLGAMRRKEVPVGGREARGREYREMWERIDAKLVAADRLPTGDWAQGPAVRAAYRPAVEATRAGTVVVLNGPAPVALGTVVERDGESAWVLTKASELPAEPKCRLLDGRTVAARVVGVDPAFDLALLKLPPAGLKSVPWAASFSPPPGTLLAAVGPRELPPAIGVVSVPRRDLKNPAPPKNRLPLRVPVAGLGVDGVAVPGGGYKVTRVFAGPALAAGIRPGDRIRNAAGTPVARAGDLDACAGDRLSGDLLAVELVRGGEKVELQLSLQVSLGTSYRKNEFPTVFETDLPVFPYECGGPVVDLAGRVVGITIARVDVPGALVLPGDSVRKLLPDLKSGKLSGNRVPPKEGPRR
ncbi:MAG: serine protease [Gemmataceae bacterium]|nr:serine protease [Gemmataceae bacterium]